VGIPAVHGEEDVKMVSRLNRHILNLWALLQYRFFQKAWGGANPDFKPPVAMAGKRQRAT